MTCNQTFGDAKGKHRTEFRDDYDHQDDHIEYIVENVLFEPTSPETFTASTEYQNLLEQFNSILLNSCSCSGADTCGQNDTCPHGGNYIPSSDECILNPSRPSKDLIYECSAACKCDPAVCQNRYVQYGPRLNLEIIASKVLHKQLALCTRAPISGGTFVCEYAGEILTRYEAQRRLGLQSDDVDDGSRSKTRDNNKMNYVLCMNEYSLDSGRPSGGPAQQTFIDPHLRGNIGRYLNHSCQPNCEIFSVRVDCPIPKIAIFARRDIKAGEELCFHYGGGVKTLNADSMQVERSTRCLCGSSSCEKVLPNLKF